MWNLSLEAMMSRAARRWPLLFIAIGVVVLGVIVALVQPARSAPAAPSPGADGSGLKANLDRIVGDPSYSGAQVGLEVREAKSGKVLYAHNANKRLNPASNTKLLTSTAAMKTLGKGHRFATQVLSDGLPSGGTVHGNLYLKGGGDPTTLAKDYDELAKTVARRGVHKITGNLIADDSYFDSRRLGSFWTWDAEPYYYQAQISGLTAAPNTDYDSGTVMVKISPGEHPGDKATVSLQPKTDYVTINNKATTGAKDSSDTSDAVRRHGNNTIDVTGSIPAGADTDTVWATVWGPTKYAAGLFRDALAKHDIKLDGKLRTGKTPSRARRLAVHRSMTLGKMLTPFLKLSNNMHAEHLTKTMGRKTRNEGTWPAGLAAIKKDARSFGVDTDKIRMVDGSGLSRGDQISPHQLTTVMRGVRDKPWFKTWYNALPIAGKSKRMVGGTLRYRMTGTAAAGNLHGKTGSLTGASGLSGYVTDSDGTKLVFSMLSNNYLVDSVQSLEDAVGVTLANYDGTSTKRVSIKSMKQSESSRSRHQNAMQRHSPHVECSWVKAC
jgi:D-alanyl-D-alanine carboxypeptidase/D-alanyl-D-alanine-endopeptidase (penicillin-binding protein 4)